MSNKNAKFCSVKNAQIMKFGDLLCRQIMQNFSIEQNARFSYQDVAVYLA